MNRDRILAFAQLLRIPNVFTAFADIALASVIGNGSSSLAGLTSSTTGTHIENVTGTSAVTLAGLTSSATGVHLENATGTSAVTSPMECSTKWRMRSALAVIPSLPTRGRHSVVGLWPPRRSVC